MNRFWLKADESFPPRFWPNSFLFSFRMNHIIHTLYLWYITFYDFSSSKVEVMNKAERSAKADTAFKVLYKIQNLMKIQRFCEDTIHDWGVGYRSDFLALWPEQGWFYHKRGVCEGTFNFFSLYAYLTFNRYNRNRK